MAIDYLKEAVEGGDADSMIELGRLYETGCDGETTPYVVLRSSEFVLILQ